jgi:hypothetical protein
VFGALREFISGPGYRGADQRSGETRNSEEGGVAFLTYFPHIDELKLLYQADIRKIYFFGDIDDEDSKDFVNNISFFDMINFE